MAHKVSYTVWLTIKIAHEYYLGDRNGFTLVPSGNTSKVLSKAGILVRQQDKCTWIFLRQDSPDAAAANELMIDLSFYIKDIDPGFYYCTDSSMQYTGTGWRIDDINSPEVWKMLIVTIDRTMLADCPAVDVTLCSAQKFLEFIVIAKSGNRIPLLLKETKERLTFNVSEIDFPREERPVYRFITQSRVTLKEIYDLNIGLWEQKENGQVLLSSNIPFPKPASASVMSPTDTISSYFYF
ncbi:hypothetical protein AAEO56_00945 [Flavobacterium sp. DGU11]|uniref:Immunity protein 43 n=1 Tax=Flavobacterium arundinis TaxID=3139143 RepID=A0ABU9HRM5_9FLAO